MICANEIILNHLQCIVDSTTEITHILGDLKVLSSNLLAAVKNFQ